MCVKSRGYISAGFTILELAVTAVVVAILAALIFAAFSSMRSRAQRVQCAANLRNLYLGAELYVQQNGNWPQIPRDASGLSPAHAEAWIDALAPFQVSRKTWICPTIQSLLGNPDFYDAAKTRLDYIPVPFDDKPMSPHQWPRQPWFVENGDVHGHGNLVIFTDGSISDLGTLVGQARREK